jgi:CubicO group peptidase (beta-lactamase class C family)
MMRLKQSIVPRAVIGALALFLVATPAQGQSADFAARWVDSIFARYASTSSPGCAVGIVRDGTLQLAKGYGMADLEHQIPIGSHTSFYLASLAKQFTAMSIVLLAQDKRLTLDDDVRKWVPEVPDFGHTITLRHLLTHTSGLRDYITLLALTGWASDGPLTKDDFLDLVSRQKDLNFLPGEQLMYSNTGYALLGLVVERASGMSLRDFAALRIFGPLGMTHTQFIADHGSAVSARALGYEDGPNGFRVSGSGSDVVGDGGAYSTIEDLARWDANFQSGRVGGKDGVAQLLQPGRLTDGDTTDYALGLSIGVFAGARTISHSGAYGGYRTTFMRFPDNDLSVITLCNVAGAPQTLAQQVASIFILPANENVDGEPDGSERLSELGRFGFVQLLDGAIPSTDLGLTDDWSAPDEERLIEGKYVSTELDMTVTIRSRDGLLVMQRPRGDDVHFSRTTSDVFTSPDQITLRLRRDDAGHVEGFTLTAGRVRDLHFARKE